MNPASEMNENCARSVLNGICANVTFCTEGSLLNPGQIRSLGVPSKEKILCSCSISAFPGKSGLRVSSSAKMHPTDHMSTAVEYCLAPSSSSGGRYLQPMACEYDGKEVG